jgi:hypothetical protein
MVSRMLELGLKPRIRVIDSVKINDMKNRVLWLGLLLGLVLTACNVITGKRVLEGAYVSHSEGKYSIADDTLVVEEGDGNMVLIHRRTGFRRLTNGRPGKKEYGLEEWTCVWNEDEGTLKELRKGRLLYLDRDSARLILGKRVYRNIK